MLRLLALLVVSGCGMSLKMPMPIAYPGACPPEDYKCQRNADAQTLAYIGESDAAKNLMCSDPSLAVYIGSGCEPLPSLY